MNLTWVVQVRIGLVGKPNVGKSTFFSAATMAQVDIANYPFCTIDPNVGVAFIEARLDCPCKDLRNKLEQDGRLKPAEAAKGVSASLVQVRALGTVAPSLSLWWTWQVWFRVQVKVEAEEMRFSQIWPTVMC